MSFRNTVNRYVQTANTEEAINLPPNTFRFVLVNRSNLPLYISPETGEVALGDSGGAEKIEGNGVFDSARWYIDPEYLYFAGPQPGASFTITSFHKVIDPAGCGVFVGRRFYETMHSFIDSPYDVSNLNGSDWAFHCCLKWNGTANPDSGGVDSIQTWHQLLCEATENASVSFSIALRTGTSAIHLAIGGSVIGVTSTEWSATLDDGIWHEILIEWDDAASEATLTLDGVEKTPQGISAPSYPGSGNLRIGFGDQLSTTGEKRPYDGEITNVYVSVGGTTQFCYELRESQQSDTIQDQSGQGNHGTAYRFNFSDRFTVPTRTSGVCDLLDNFTTTDDAPVTTPRTCEGTGTVVFAGSDAGTDFEIIGGKLRVTASGIDDNRYVYGQSTFSRVAGRRMEALITAVDNDQLLSTFMWSTSATGDYNGSNNEGSLYLGNDLPSPHSAITYEGSSRLFQIESVEDSALIGEGEDIFTSVVLRASGFHLFYTRRDGLLRHGWVHEAGSTANLYSIITTRNADPMDVDWWAVLDTSNLYDRTTICSDSFVRSDSSSIGSTDDSGCEETGGATIAWTETAIASGQAEIVSNRLRNTASGAGDEVICDVETDESDVILQATLYASDFAGIVFRKVNDSNYMAAIRFSDDVTGEELRLIKVVGGTPTTLVSDTSQLSTINAGDEFKMTVVCEGGHIKAWVEESATDNVTFDGAIVELEKGTRHGVYLDNSETGPVYSECSRFVVWDRIVTDYT